MDRRPAKISRFNEGQGRIAYLGIEVDDALEITEQTEI